MVNEKGFLDKIESFVSLLKDLFVKRAKVLIVSHNDADGITSAGILSFLLHKMKVSFNSRILKELNPREIDNLASENYDFYLIADFGASLTPHLDEKIKNYFIIDHHEIPESEREHLKVLNPWQFDIDGSTQISSAGLCYYAAKNLDFNGKFLSILALVGALGDRQDQGKDRSLLGLNEVIIKDAQDSLYLQTKKDLLLYGSETKPLYKLLASLENPYMPELFGREDKCIAVLNSYGLNLKDALNWRTLSDLGYEEKKKIFEIIVYHSRFDQKNLENLVGQRYLLNYEEPHSPLKDAREFATLLNACGRLQRASLGLSLTLGDRKILKRAEELLAEYRKKLAYYTNTILNQERFIERRRNFSLVKGDVFLDENFTGALASILLNYTKFRGEVIVARALTNGEFKISARSDKEDVNLGKALQKASTLLGEMGGGHKRAGGARIRANKIEEFLKILEDELEH
ncbi:MAG: DHH family phosphoesterase [Nitrososphaerales archaeon]